MVDLTQQDLSHVSLAGMDLRGLDLSGKTFRYTDFFNANLSGTNLGNACLENALLGCACLDGANLAGANLEEAILIEASLVDAKLRDANLKASHLSRADLTEADLSHANLVDAFMVDTKGLLDPKVFMNKNFQKTEKGYFVYTPIGGYCYHEPSPLWIVEEAKFIEMVVNHCRTSPRTSGIVFATKEYYQEWAPLSKIWKCLLHWEDLCNLVVPYNTDGVAYCARLQLLKQIWSD